MERTEWLKKMRAQAEGLYDHLAPGYWVTFGFYPNGMHCEFVDKFLGRLGQRSHILDAGCGAGRYDGMLVEAGHSVLGIDQSSKMLAKAREHFPEEQFPGLRYAKLGLQEINSQAEFDGLICVDALEHVCPEDWPGIVARFQEALRPEGPLYFTVEVPDWGEVNEAYQRAKAMGLPVVFGEVVYAVDAGYAQADVLDWQALPAEQVDASVYHYHPRLEQVRAWLDGEGLAIEEEGFGDGYAHFLVRKNTHGRQDPKSA